jgi:hypothetical protein
MNEGEMIGELPIEEASQESIMKQIITHANKRDDQAV